MSSETTIILTTDGAARDNQNEDQRRAGFGYVIEHDKKRIAEEYQYVGQHPMCTNNFAEYEAVITGIQDVKERFADRDVGLRLQSDSEVVIKQLTGAYSVNEMRKQYDLCMDELSSFSSWQAEHVSEAPGNDIDRADTLANKSFE